jgi:gamma-glutamyltranspeptidase/glutathione hydrolase
MRIRRFARAAVAALTTLGTVAVTQALDSPAAPPEGERYSKLRLVRTTGGVVSSVSAQASAAGIEILDRGGNAMDAAIATTFAIGVTRPDYCGPGAAGHLVYRAADGTVAALDFREAAPQAMGPNTFNLAFDGKGPTNQLRPGAHRVDGGSGHLTVGVPGMVAGMDAAYRSFGSGTLRFDQLIAPAEKLARDGIMVTSGLTGNLIAFQPKFANYPESARLYGGSFAFSSASFQTLEQTSPLVFRQAEYADSLLQIMAHGRDAFYKVEEYDDPILGSLRKVPSIGKLIVEDMKTAFDEGQRNPVLLARTAGEPNDIGLITALDLLNYQAKWKAPLVGQYRNHQVITMPPPASGMTVLEILNLLEHFKLADFGHSSADHLHVLAEAQKLAWADRLEYLADDIATARVDLLTSKGYAQQRGREIDLANAKSIQDYGGARAIGAAPEGANTTHLSVIDSDGNAAAITCSLNAPFGSGVIAKGTGFFLNNELLDFDVCWQDAGVRPPDDEDDCRAQGFPPNAPGPGKRPRSSQSPTIVVKGGMPVLATGGAGAQSVPMGVVQNIVNVVDFGMDIFHAIDAPRMDAAAANAWWAAMDPIPPNPDFEPQENCASQILDHSYLALEHVRMSDEVLQELADDPATDVREGRGHRLCLVDWRDGYVGLPLLHSAGTDLRTGERLAVADPRAFQIDVFRTPLAYYDDQGPAGQQPRQPPPLLQACTPDLELAGLCCTVVDAETGHCESN